MADVYGAAHIVGMGMDHTALNYNISIEIIAGDDTYDEAGSVLVQIPIGMTEEMFNSRLRNAAVDWIRTKHSWQPKPENVFFQTYFKRG